MNQQEHKAAAENLIAWVEFGHYQMWSDVVKNQLLKAQVHATLALIPDIEGAAVEHGGGPNKPEKGPWEV